MHDRRAAAATAAERTRALRVAPRIVGRVVSTFGAKRSMAAVGTVRALWARWALWTRWATRAVHALRAGRAVSATVVAAAAVACPCTTAAAAAAAASSRLVPASDAGLLALLGIGLALVGVLIGRRGRGD